MTHAGGREERTIDAAERIRKILADHGAESAVIGAMALAVHRYVRLTRDFDLASSTDPFSTLREVERAAREAGFRTELRLPDADDPLGGVLEVTGPDFKPVQVVNYRNPLAPSAEGARLAEESIESSRPGLIERSDLRVVDLPHLVALKLYGGGPKNRNDVIELVERNQPLDLSAILEVCDRHGLSSRLRRVLDELRLA